MEKTKQNIAIATDVFDLSELAFLGVKEQFIVWCKKSEFLVFDFKETATTCLRNA